MCAISSAAAMSQIASHGTAVSACDDEEDRQQVDEPQRAERLDEGLRDRARPTSRQPVSAANAGALKANWIVTQSDIEIGEVHHLAVEIGCASRGRSRAAGTGRRSGRSPACGTALRRRRRHASSRLAGRVLHAEHRVHHHHHDDADALGIVDPVDPAAGGPESPLAAIVPIVPWCPVSRRGPRLCRTWRSVSLRLVSYESRAGF